MEEGQRANPCLVASDFAMGRRYGDEFGRGGIVSGRLDLARAAGDLGAESPAEDGGLADPVVRVALDGQPA